MILKRKSTRSGKPKGRRKKKILRKKICKFCADRINHIDYKDVSKLQRYVTEKGKIIPRKVNGNCAKHQTYLATSVKRARQIALLPYSV